MALCVVTIHCNIVNHIPNEILSRFAGAIIYTAVPIFYTVSALFLYRHLEFNEKGYVINKDKFLRKQNRYLLRIAKMYVTWMTLYFCMTHVNLFTPNIVILIKAYASEFFLWGSGYLWYLWGLLLIIPLISKILINRNRGIVLVVLSFLAMCLFRLYSHFGSVSEPSWWQRPLVYMWQGHIVNIYAVCYSFAFITVGAFMATNNWWKKLTNIQLLLILMLGILYACIDYGSVCIGYQPVALAAVALCLRWNIKRESFWFGKLRILSTYIYLTHIFVVLFLHTIGVPDGFNHWLISLIGSLVVSNIVIWAKESK